MKAKTALTKQKILSELIEIRHAILDTTAQLSTEARSTVFLGTWTIKDLLAHLAGWDFTNLAAAQDIQAGKLPDFYAHYDKDWKTYNAKLVAKYKRNDFKELLALVHDSQRQLMEYLESVSAEAFKKDFSVLSGRGTKVMIARLLQAEWKDEQKHLEQIQNFAAKVQSSTTG